MSNVLNALVAASRDWIGDSPTGAMLSATRAFQSEATRDASVLREASDSLPMQEPGPSAWIAVALGTLVERGTSAELTGPAVLDTLKAWLPSLPATRDDQTPVVPTPEQAVSLSRFQFLCQSAVTHLARLPAQREAWGRDPHLLERLAGLRALSYGAWWVHEALLKASGTLILLHPPSGSGAQLRYTNISNCFHLFSLLQTAVGTSIPGGREPDASANEAWWHYGSPLSRKADLASSIWGEGLVRDIPRVDGVQVMLLWPPILQASAWDSAFLGPHLEAMPADATLDRMLAPEESQAWLDKLGIRAQRKPWWRFY